MRTSARLCHGAHARTWPPAGRTCLVKMATHPGGYDYDFISSIPEELRCSICLQVFRDPNLTSCCGNRYCKGCIDRVQLKAMPCPLCQRRGFTLMLDKMYVRKVNSLQVKCPNIHRGCQWRGELGKVKEHQQSCDAVTVPCKFHSMGCGATVTLATMEDHLDETSGKHLSLLLQAVQGKDRQIAKLEQTVSSLQEEVRTLRDDMRMLALQLPQEEPKQYPPVTLVMEDFYTHMYGDTVWHSDGFYTHPRGYKMCLTVYANGVGKGKHSHVSVFATLMKGEYDDDLEWPFKGHVTVELLDPDYLGIEPVEEVFKFNARTPPRAKFRCWEEERHAYGHGNPEFILQDNIPYPVDSLHFLVTRVGF